MTNTTSSTKMTAFIRDSDNWTYYVSASKLCSRRSNNWITYNINSFWWGTDEINNISTDFNGYKFVGSFKNSNSLASPYKLNYFKIIIALMV